MQCICNRYLLYILSALFCAIYIRAVENVVETSYFSTHSYLPTLPDNSPLPFHGGWPANAELREPIVSALCRSNCETGLWHFRPRGLSPHGRCRKDVCFSTMVFTRSCSFFYCSVGYNRRFVVRIYTARYYVGSFWMSKWVSADTKTVLCFGVY